jgi:hypothetical protein|tara:strand:+ start:4887 stop:5009 length:123 start_codon:yes stop_codon:yes gene_type:complete
MEMIRPAFNFFPLYNCPPPGKTKADNAAFFGDLLNDRLSF